MNFYALKEWLRYRWRAKTRHGIHSPFVYDFIERVLHDMSAIDIPAFAKNHRLQHKYLLLIARLMRHCRIAGAEVAVITEEPGIWNALLERQLKAMGKNGVIVIAGIHKNAGSTQTWNQICGMPEIPMTIDVYGVGLLFFKEEFKEKQHFVLRY